MLILFTILLIIDNQNLLKLYANNIFNIIDNQFYIYIENIMIF